MAKTATPTPRPSPFQFSTETTSVSHITQLLQNTGNNFTSIINGHQDTFLRYSSKSRLLDALSFIYKNHGTFLFFASMYQQGMYHAFTQTLSNDELDANMARVNHQLVTKRPEILEEKLERDVQFGFLFQSGHCHSVASQAPWYRLVVL